MFLRILASVRLFAGQNPWRNRYTQGAAKLAFSVMLAQGITFIGSLILARAILHLYDELGLKGPVADQHRSKLQMLSLAKPIPDPKPGSESMF